MRRHLAAGDVAAVILEPVAGNMGCIAPAPGYLEALREATREAGALLIIDEVMTGFRLARGGACERFGIDADLVTLGKIVGGGLPLAAFGGRREIMQRLSPVGPVYQAGTLSGNPLAVAAGRATLGLLTAALYDGLEARSAELEDRVLPAVQAAGWSMARVGSMFTLFARPQPPWDFEQVKTCDLAAFGRFHRQALDAGVYLPPAQFEAAFLPAGLTDAEMDHLVDGITAALAP